MDTNIVVEMEACKFCDRLVPTTSLLTHSAHCEREVRRSGGLQQCPMCDLEIPKKRMQRHIDTEHVTDNCPECHKLFERRSIKHHLETECQMRGVTCTFCDLSILARDLEKHMVHCGTRSEKCSECGETIMLKYKTIHLESNHGFIQLDDEPTHFPMWTPGISSSSKPNATPSVSTRSHQYLPKGEPNLETSDDVARVELPCEFCGEIFPAYRLNGHQLGCRLKQQTEQKVHNTSTNTAPATSSRQNDEDEEASSSTTTKIDQPPIRYTVEDVTPIRPYTERIRPLSMSSMFPIYPQIHDRHIGLRSFDYLNLSSDNSHNSHRTTSTREVIYSETLEDINEKTEDDRTEESNLIPCEYCNRMLHIGEVMRHQMICFLQQ